MSPDDPDWEMKPEETKPLINLEQKAITTTVNMPSSLGKSRRSSMEGSKVKSIGKFNRAKSVHSPIMGIF